MLGMTLAHRLAQQGQRVTLCEAAPQLGGLASAWTLGDVVWDRHYHVTLLSDTHLRALLDEIGLEKRNALGRNQNRLLLRRQAATRCPTPASSSRFPPLQHVGTRCGWAARSSSPRSSATGSGSKKSPSPTGSAAGPAAARSKKSGCRCCGPSWAKPIKKTSAAFIWAHTPADVQSPPLAATRRNVRLRARRLRPHPRSPRRSAANRKASKSAATRPSTKSPARRREPVSVQFADGSDAAIRPRRLHHARRPSSPRLPAAHRRRARTLRRRRLPRHRLLVAALEETDLASTTSRTSPTPGCRSPPSSR